MFKISLIFILLSYSLLTNAITFRRLSLEQLIDESSSAVEVHLESKKAFMNSMGLIMTEHSFRVSESYNLEKNEMENGIFKLTLTGGTANGVTSYIDGAPEFVTGERSFLLLKKIENRLYMSNFTLGKYKVIEENGKTFYVSSVFPNDPDMGKVTKERMLEVIRDKFKISSVIRNIKNVTERQKSIYQVPDKKRIPAQVSVDFKKEEFPYSLLLTTLSTFVICGVIAYKVFKKKDDC